MATPPMTFGNPDTQGLVRRSKFLEDAIKGLQATPQSQFNTSTGTWGNVLSNAILAYAGNEASGKADAAKKADNQRLTDAIMGTPQKTAEAQLGQAAPFNLTPGGFEGRTQDTEDARLAAIAEMAGPMGLLEYQQGQRTFSAEQAAAAAKARIEQDKLGIEERRLAFDMGKPTVVDNALVKPDGTPLYTAPADPYTLGPDQQRFSGDNTVVATGLPKKDENGISLSFGEDGGILGLNIGGPNMPLGGDGPKGKGPAVVRGPDGQPVVTPGQQQLVANKSYQAMMAGGEKTGLVREEIARALPLVKEGTTGVWASTKDLPFVGSSTESGQLANVLKTIKANVGFDELQAMRDNSPTGGALGQVAVQELEMLQAILGSFEQAQRPEDLTLVLKRLDNYMANRDERRKEAFAMDYPELAEFAGFAQRTAAEVKRIASAADYNALPSGAEYVDPSGVKRRKP
jgi:hypothetical protein